MMKGERMDRIKLGISIGEAKELCERNDCVVYYIDKVSCEVFEWHFTEPAEWIRNADVIFAVFEGEVD